MPRKDRMLVGALRAALDCFPPTETVEFDTEYDFTRETGDAEVVTDVYEGGIRPLITVYVECPSSLDE